MITHVWHVSSASATPLYQGSGELWHEDNRGVEDRWEVMKTERRVTNGLEK